jgi:hypothetical protein
MSEDIKGVAGQIVLGHNEALPDGARSVRVQTARGVRELAVGPDGVAMEVMRLPPPTRRTQLGHVRVHGPTRYLKPVLPLGLKWKGSKGK